MTTFMWGREVAQELSEPAYCAALAAWVDRIASPELMALRRADHEAWWQATYQIKPPLWSDYAA